MNEKQTQQNAAYYWEVCILKRMLQMGFINRSAFEGICRIAAEDYGATLPFEQICV